MEVVLVKEVKGLGDQGEIRRVADGYARNYLIPRGLAVPASAGARKQVAERIAAEERRQAMTQDSAARVAARLQDAEVVFTARAGEGGRLFGSITNADIAAKLAEIAGEPVDKRKIVLAVPLKELGTYAVNVRLHSDVQFTVNVTIEADSTN